MKANKLSCKDLMVGDWMLDGENIAQITSITCDGIIETTFNESSNIEVIEPIPLTTEILEKNGWFFNNEDEKFFPQTWVDGGLMLQGADDCGFCIVVTSNYDDEDTNDTPFILFYVHELQHALRLRRIEKEIIL